MRPHPIPTPTLEVSGPRHGGETRECLLDAAEKLFARRGIDASSLRAITRRAGANLASVHYHFGSKEGLIQAVFARRLGPLNQERLALLDACEAAAADVPPALEAVLRAFIAPVLHMIDCDGPGGRAAHGLARLVMQVLSDPKGPTRAIVLEELREVKERFLAALARALPELPAEELCWRFHFLIGAVAHTAGAGYLVAEHFDGLCDTTDVEATITRLTGFLAAGLRSPAVGEKETSDAIR